MNDGLVIDANVMADFPLQLCSESGDLYELINRIIDKVGIVVDDGCIIINE